MKPVRQRFRRSLRLFTILFVVGLTAFFAVNVKAQSIAVNSQQSTVNSQHHSGFTGIGNESRSPQIWQNLARTSYATGEFAEAAKYWRQAVAGFEVGGDWLNQAIALSNLSLTYQQLGDWKEANSAIAQSRSLLPEESKVQSPGELNAIGQILDIQANGQWEQGQINLALQTGKQATNIYVKLKDDLGWKRSLIAQVKTLQELGLYQQACQTLIPVVESNNSENFVIPSQDCQQLITKILEPTKGSIKSQSTSNSKNIPIAEVRLVENISAESNPTLKTIQIAGARLLGDVWRQLGYLNESKQWLAEVERVITQGEYSQEKALVLLSLGNTYQSLGNRNKFLSDFNNNNPDKNYQTGIDYYRKGVNLAPNNSFVKVQGQLNLLSLLVESKIELALKAREIQQLRLEILSQLSKLPPSHKLVYAEVSLMNSLVEFKNKLENPNNVSNSSNANSEKILNYCLPNSAMVAENVLGNIESVSWGEVGKLGAKAIALAKDLGDFRATAYALGNLGTVYQKNQQWLEAQQCTEQALLLSQNVRLNAPDLTYQWQWQLGRIRWLGEAKDVKGAIGAYTAAFNTLQSLRNDLVPISRDGQFDFRDRVEPFYRELVDLLLQGENPIQEKLKQARNVIEALQVAELDNFFREACIQPREVNIDNIDKESAVIYPIILNESLEVIIKFSGLGELKHYRTKIDSQIVKKVLMEVQEKIVNANQNNIQELKTSLYTIYSWLLKTAKIDLDKNNIKTLVFVLDGELRNLPMAALYDGSRYLIESYSLVLAPGLNLTDAKQLKLGNIKILAAGISEARPGFSALPNVKQELKEIQSQVSSIVLLNSEFIDSSLRAKINSNESRIVHLATHGKFSSNAENTYIINWDKRININELNQLLKSRNEKQSKPIELLVLSACQTAAGDNRATLGLAGVAVRAGARSTLASLWNIPDDSTSVLMKQFYKELLTNKRTKAEALRQAQLFLLKNPSYNNPKIWSPYILVGNWL
ncbi:CHAT domain-containing protein [Tychonema sp. BBK16]|uniref:CHAT domain-containing protein n=1 Tax=Tychonema sp. BBK16 TaxID=2699888 RepID=UPI001F38672D|nr:CHAT domain-containing protein [Tychonema sp. BBK16]MCF6372198.1 CHAT domain-containing protein [Tychonema sp. BBK16]